MSLKREQAAFMNDLRRLLTYAIDDCHLLVTGGELERKPEMQQMYVKSGYDTTMDSMHLRSCAIALTFFQDTGNELRLVQDQEVLLQLAAFWESLDPRNRWGGRSNKRKDFSRFERDLGAWPSKTASRLLAPSTTVVQKAMAPAGGDRGKAVVLAETATAMQLATLRRGGARQHSAITRLQQLLNTLNLLAHTTGEFDAETERAVCEFQRNSGLVVDGVVGEKTWSALLAQSHPEQHAAANLFLGDKDLEAAAQTLAIPLAAMKAVYKVESNGSGFIGQLPKILFEGHVFWRRLQAAGINPAALQAGNEDILYPKWTKAYYKGGVAEHQRLQRAKTIHEEAALESASWGLFQILGYHWKTLGYQSANHFAQKMAEHEREQLHAFVRFMQVTTTKDKRTLAEVLAAQDWAAFAYAYNGPKYRENLYDDKLRKAFFSYSSSTFPT